MLPLKDVFIVTFFLLVTNAAAQSECGDFYRLNHNEVGYIHSPNYPNDYPNNSFCIWLIEAPQNHSVQLTVTFTGERYNNTCSDYLEIRQGSKNEELTGIFCDESNGMVLTSKSRWFWIKFKSDRILGVGTPMIIEFHAVYNSSKFMNSTVPYSICRSYEFACRNMECHSMSYRCDGQNDCGCLKDCDESMCEGLPLSKQAQVIIAVVTGFGSFCILCLVTYCIEGKNNWIASQTEAVSLREKEIIAEKQRQRASRAFSKFIGGEKDLLLNVPKSKMNLAGGNLSSITLRS
ncbi:hypothetical protein BsWGS_12469 [Bradybaena similaris]